MENVLIIYVEKKAELYECRHCHEYFCKEHLNATLVGLPKFNDVSPKAQMFMGEFRKAGHPCFPYVKVFEEKLKEEKRKNDEAWKKIDIAKKFGPIYKNKIEKPLEVFENEIEDLVPTLSVSKRPNKIKSSKNNRAFLFVVIFFALIVLLYFFLPRNFDDFESKNMTDIVFSDINNFRQENNLSLIDYDENAYKMSIDLSTKFYTNNDYSVSDSELKILSLKYNLIGVEILSTKLENLDEGQFTFMTNNWINKDIFSDKILNKGLNDGAIGCYHESCVFILGIKSRPVQAISPNINKNYSTQKLTSNVILTDNGISKYETNEKLIHLTYFDFATYGGVNDYLSGLDKSISYYYVPPTTKDFILKDLNDQVQDEFLMPLVKEIENEKSNKKEQAFMAIRLVQNIPYDWESFNSGKSYGRYPYEVLYDNTGVCGEKSELLAYLLSKLGFGVAIFEFEKENHRAVGIKCNNGNYGTDYCFVETTDPYPIGQIPRQYVGGVDIRNANPEVVIISDGITYE